MCSVLLAPHLSPPPSAVALLALPMERMDSCSASCPPALWPGSPSKEQRDGEAEVQRGSWGLRSQALTADWRA